VAAQYRPNLERAQRVARRLVDRLGLEPPVDVRSVIGRYAEVEEDNIPGHCDAVVVGLGTLPRPRVVVDRGQAPRRKRFSLGHELGHILIPGHIGFEVCLTEEFFVFSPYEREAHAFASEILVPGRWFARVLDESDSLTQALEEIRIADVSPAASCLAAARMLPRGCVLSLMSGSVVEMALVSPGTEANAPPQGHVLDEPAMDRFSVDHGRAFLHGREIRWWTFEDATKLAPVGGVQSASEILREIVGEVGPHDPEGRRSTLSSINGIAGYAKGGFNRAGTPEQMLARLRARFAGRPGHERIVGHHRFDEYLAQKARELTERSFPG
jgi:hypothetical protein